MASRAALPPESPGVTVPSAGGPGISHGRPGPRGNSSLRLIAAFKLTQALLLAALALGTLHFLRPTVTAQVQEWMTAMPYDARDDLVRRLVAWFLGIPRGHAQALALGTLFYSALFAIEGGGLWLRRRWAEWLTVIATGSFIPLEVYELIRGPGILKAALITVNVAIVVYLVRLLRAGESNHTGAA